MADVKEIIRRGSDNVFADLGRADAETHKLKAELAHKIGTTLKDRGLKQKAASDIMGISQPEVSRLLQGKFRDMSAERMMRLLNRLEMDIDITVRRRGEAVGETFRLEAIHA